MDSLLQGPVILVLPQSDIHPRSVQEFCKFAFSQPEEDKALENLGKCNKTEQRTAGDIPESEAQHKDQNKKLTDSQKPSSVENDLFLPQTYPPQEKNNLFPIKSLDEEKEKENQENIDPQQAEEFCFRRVHFQNPNFNAALESSGQQRGVSYVYQTTLKQIGRLRKTISKPIIQDAVQISQEKIIFGKLVPGQSCQESILLKNKTSQNIQISIEVDLLFPELKKSEESVYSVRRHTGEKPTSKYSTILAASSTSTFLIAIKAPSRKLTGKIKGFMRVTAEGFSDCLLIDLVCLSYIPRISCPSELYHSHFQCGIVNLAIKRGKKQETRIPFKNESDIPLVLTFGFFSAKNTNKERQHFCKISPNVAKLPPKGMGVLALSITNSEIDQKRKDENRKKERIQEILVCRIVESTIFYSFVLSIEIY